MDNQSITVKEAYDKAMEAKAKGDFMEAFNLLNACVNSAPDDPACRLQLTLIANELAKPTEHFRDIAHFNATQLVQIQPEEVNNWIALGEISLQCHRYPESIAAYEKAIEMDPNNAKTLTILGFAYTRLGKHEDAMNVYHKAVKIDPELGDVHFLLSCMYIGSAYNPQAQAYHGERGFQCDKPCKLPIESCWNAAQGHLASGNFELGWNYFEARLRRNMTNQGQQLPQERFTKPLWNRQTNCRVLIQHEMGFGDAFLMARFFRGFRDAYNLEIQFECQPHMLELMQRNFPEIPMVEWQKADENTFDYHLPMMSLPLACQVGSDSQLWNGSYIEAAPHKVEEWAEKLPRGFKVGLCWAGGQRNFNSMNYDTDKRRSLSYNEISRLFHVPGIEFISLQAGDKDFPIHEDVKSFHDTAAIIENMDIIVTVDTAVANLAGAMGKTVFLLNRYDSCWRWNRPWFPTAIDIRQTKSGIWSDVLDKAKEMLALNVERKAA